MSRLGLGLGGRCGQGGSPGGEVKDEGEVCCCWRGGWTVGVVGGAVGVMGGALGVLGDGGRGGFTTEVT